MTLKPTPLPSSSLRLQRLMKPHSQSCRPFSRNDADVAVLCETEPH
jgi:hypothetical protein